MTKAINPDEPQPENGQASLLPEIAQRELLRVRLLPAELARLLGVSRQSVSRWIDEGKLVMPSPLDGRLDLQRALRDVLRNTDPGRLRARFLRQAVEDVAGLRENLAAAEDRATAAEAALQDAQRAIEARDEWIAAAERAASIFKQLIVDQADELRTAPLAEWPAILRRIEIDADAAADVDTGEPADALDADLDALDAELDAMVAEATQAARELSEPDGERGE